MKKLNTFQTHSYKSLLWIFAIFLSIMAVGCSKKDSAIESLKAKNVAITADSLTDNGFTALKAAGSKPDIVQALKTAGATE